MDRKATFFSQRWAAFGLLITVSATGFLGCQGGEAVTESGEKAASAAKRPKIALIMKSLANEFFSTMATGAEKYEQESGRFELIVNGIQDERDLARQVTLVEEAIVADVDAIVIAPADSKALVPVLKRAIDSGIVVVNIDNRLDAQVLKEAEATIPFVGPNNREGARRVGEALASQLKAGDRVAILEGITTSFNGQERKAGFEQAMAAAQIEIVSSQSAQWEMAQAASITASLLAGDAELDAILACNDSMALGALSSVRSANRVGQVKIVGFDNIQAIQDAVKAGEVTATADQHGDLLAVYGIDAALQILSGEATPEDRETPVDLVTRESLQGELATGEEGVEL